MALKLNTLCVSLASTLLSLNTIFFFKKLCAWQCKKKTFAFSWAFFELKGKAYRYYKCNNRVRFKLGLTHKFIFFINTFFKHFRKYRSKLLITSKFLKKIIVRFLFFRNPNTYSENGIKHLFLNRVYKMGKVSLK